jgi:hypothetical protein
LVPMLRTVKLLIADTVMNTYDKYFIETKQH